MGRLCLHAFLVSTQHLGFIAVSLAVGTDNKARGWRVDFRIMPSVRVGFIWAVGSGTVQEENYYPLLSPGTGEVYDNYQNSNLFV